LFGRVLVPVTQPWPRPPRPGDSHRAAAARDAARGTSSSPTAPSRSDASRCLSPGHGPGRDVPVTVTRTGPSRTSGRRQRPPAGAVTAR